MVSRAGVKEPSVTITVAILIVPPKCLSFLALGGVAENDRQASSPEASYSPEDFKLEIRFYELMLMILSGS